MNIGLIDLDTSPGWASLSLMKLSAWHKAQGDRVEWHDPMFSNNDRVYVSKLFDWSCDYPYEVPCETVCGGTGYSLMVSLPAEVEDVYCPDYSIYPACRFSIQLYSRGCIRKCQWCVVPEKEGSIKSVPAIGLNPNGTHIEVLDNNFFANPLWQRAIDCLLTIGQPVNLHGVDARTVGEQEALALRRLTHHRQIHIAWDDPACDMLPHFERILEYLPKTSFMCYVLIGYGSTLEEDIWRIRKVHELGMTPYVMPMDRREPHQRRFQKWVNGHAFKSVRWVDFCRQTTTKGTDR